MPVVIHLKKPKQSPITAITEGVRAPLNAIGFSFQHKGFWPLMLIIFLFNGLIFCASVYLAFTRIYPLLKSFVPSTSGWYMFLVSMISGTVITLVTLFCAIIFYAFAGTLFASPVLDVLSAGTEKHLAGEKPARRGIIYPFSEIPRIFLMFLRGLIAVIVSVVILFPLNLIPFAGNLLYSVLSLGAVGFFTGSPFFSYPLDRRNIDGGSKMVLLWKYKWSVIGTGIGFLIICFIPFLGFLSHCFTTVGAATIFKEKILPYIELSHTPDEN